MINDRLTLAPLKPPAPGAAPVEWRVAASPVGYAEAVALMEKRVATIAAGTAPPLVWLIEPPPLFTARTRAPREGLPGTECLPGPPHRPRGPRPSHWPRPRVRPAPLPL